ncbi:hypothetical protein MASR1M97_16810 [Candidatus Desulfobacillus denitrificans]
MRLEVVLVEELDRVGRHHRQIEFRRQRHAGRHQLLGLRLAVALDLDVVAVGKEARPFGRRRFGLGRRAQQQRLADVAAGGARESDEAAVVAGGQGGAGDFRAAAAARPEIGLGQQLAQAQVAAAVLRQQQQARRPVAVAGADGGLDPDVAADDRASGRGCARRYRT